MNNFAKYGFSAFVLVVLLVPLLPFVPLYWVTLSILSASQA